jgi:endothelin-converting enzyme/putative endopeptidase
MYFRNLLFTLLLTFPIHAEDTTATTPGIAVSSMESSIRPGDNFYLYANGDWIKRTVLPPDRTSLGVFNVLADRSNERVASIIEGLSKSNPATGSDQKRIGDLYHSYMDEAAIEKNGAAQLKSHLVEISSIHNQRDLARALGLTLRADVDALNNTNFHTMNLFGLWVAPSFNDSDHYTAYLLQGGIALPDRSYYLTDSDHMKDVRTKYQQHVTTMFRLGGFDQPEMRAARVIALEHAIAEKHLSLAENEDIHKANNTWAPADFESKAPGLDWKEFFHAAGLDHQTSFIVWQPTAFTGEASLVSSTPIDTWKDYLAFHLMETYASGISRSFADERFDFSGKILTGATQQRPRDIRAIQIVNGWLGDAVGQIYAQKYFSPEAKQQVEDLVANLIAAFRQRLESITWMAPATKTEALAKLSALRVSVGYPEKWRSYNDLEIKADNLFGNLWHSSLFEYRYQLSRIGQPVDRSEWTMEPQTVNAVNLPLHNALNFPAAILEPPFFDPKAPAAANYGSIGSIIGHEISHTFDSEGAAFDSKGRVRNWWTPEDFAHFKAATSVLAAQYDTYKPFPDLSVNGHQTLGENIADVAGIAAAFDAYHASLKGSPAPLVDHLTGDQQFFIAFAQSWGTKIRDNALRQRVLTDPHAPDMYRAATVRNIDGWYAAFNVKPADKLYLAPDDRVRIW